MSKERTKVLRIKHMKKKTCDMAKKNPPVTSHQFLPLTQALMALSCCPHHWHIDLSASSKYLALLYTLISVSPRAGLLGLHV